jgi:hypothetical protein
LEDLNGKNFFLKIQNGGIIWEHWWYFSKNNRISRLYTKKMEAKEAIQGLTEEQEEGKSLHGDYKNEELYNSPLTEWEFDEALARCAGSSPDSDHIHFDFFKKIARTEKLKLLVVFEQSWKTGDGGLSNTYYNTKIGRDAKHPENYQPISLTSCLFKIMEIMVNKRLVHVIDERNLLHEQQYGLKKTGPQQM